MFTLNCNGKLIVAHEPLVMGIINITENSFFEGSRVSDDDSLLERVEKMIRDGADILDIGAQSSKPGAEPVLEEVELERIEKAIMCILSEFPEVILSVDTYRSVVAKRSVEMGASIINDISGGNLDKIMIEVVGQLNVPYICMHMKGTPATMNSEAKYDDLLKEVIDYFVEKVDVCRTAGIKDLIIDPGFGFAKTAEQNFAILKNLGLLKIMDMPIMVGLSRKSTISKVLEVSTNDTLNGSTVLHTMSLMNGANILRVHDVKEAKECVKLYNAYMSEY